MNVADVGVKVPPPVISTAFVNELEPATNVWSFAALWAVMFAPVPPAPPDPTSIEIVSSSILVSAKLFPLAAGSVDLG